jgi:hypothetical protein
MPQMINFDPNSPVFPPLASYMKVDLAANSRGSIWILHDKPLPDLLGWADYDAASGVITLAMETGKTQPLGVAVPEAMAGPLQDSVQVSVVLMENQTVVDFTVVPLNVAGSIGKD